MAVTGVAMLGGLGLFVPRAAPAQAGGGLAPESALRLTGFFDGPGDGRPGVAAPDSGPGSVPAASSTTLPADSGDGRRVVFSISRQRVWLVGSGDRVLRTYLVSGSLTDNLRPGTFEVYSTSRHAVGVDDSGTMEYMVRFTHGDNAPIGFHDIPVRNGQRVQAFSDLGTPQSHGCIRQRRSDARRLWEFAPVGTAVVVTV